MLLWMRPGDDSRVIAYHEALFGLASSPLDANKFRYLIMAYEDFMQRDFVDKILSGDEEFITKSYGLLRKTFNIN